ncbi:unnamed protein product [Pieris macdunnoughi]|uniref:PiggyBac transposable element-derived protein domain-containing protein n=1 Tax=Pieris macdunnoughi TaxID=345717 RepID=A0A821XIZ8_9NEOP|nr:unnamed protein product [Pieris macdunnoughi]
MFFTKQPSTSSAEVQPSTSGLHLDRRRCGISQSSSPDVPPSVVAQSLTPTVPDTAMSDTVESDTEENEWKKRLENLHLNDNMKMPPRGTPDYDKLYKVRPLLEILNKSCQSAAKTTTSQPIDESMIQFKGISSLKQYMPLKPIIRGYKVSTRADSKTGYVFEFQIYTAKRADQSTGLYWPCDRNVIKEKDLYIFFIHRIKNFVI